MPRVALTDAQRRKNAAKDVYKTILDALNAKRGLVRKTHQDFAEEIGISYHTWWRWNNGELCRAEFGKVLDAAMRCGVSLSVITN